MKGTKKKSVKNVNDVGKLAKSLQDAGAVNLDMKISDLLKVEGVGKVDPTSPLAATVVAWDGYAVILPSAKNIREEVLSDINPK